MILFQLQALLGLTLKLLQKTLLITFRFHQDLFSLLLIFKFQKLLECCTVNYFHQLGFLNGFSLMGLKKNYTGNQMIQKNLNLSNIDIY